MKKDKRGIKLLKLFLVFAILILTLILAVFKQNTKVLSTADLKNSKVEETKATG